MIEDFNLSQDFIDNVLVYMKKDYLVEEDFNIIFNFLKIKIKEYQNRDEILENNLEYELSLLLLSLDHYNNHENFNLTLFEYYGKIYINIIKNQSKLSNIYYLYPRLLYYCGVFYWQTFNNIHDNISNKSFSSKLIKKAALLGNKLSQIETLCYDNEEYLKEKVNILKLYEELYINKNLYAYKRIIYYYEDLYMKNHLEEDFNKMYFFINEALNEKIIMNKSNILYLKYYYELIKFNLNEEDKLERIKKLEELKFYDCKNFFKNS